VIHFKQRHSGRGRPDSRPRFTVGQSVLLNRDLPTQRANSKGTIRGLTPTPDGISYAIRFDNGMRVVNERDLRAVGIFHYPAA
jgi:hypothetical protein